MTTPMTPRKRIQLHFDVASPCCGASSKVHFFQEMAGEAKYHLVYVTTHPRGIIEFMEISEGISPDPTVFNGSNRQLGYFS
jgi:hypothetical protein